MGVTWPSATTTPRFASTPRTSSPSAVHTTQKKMSESTKKGGVRRCSSFACGRCRTWLCSSGETAQTERRTATTPWAISTGERHIKRPCCCLFLLQNRTSTYLNCAFSANTTQTQRDLFSSPHLLSCFNRPLLLLFKGGCALKILARQVLRGSPSSPPP